MLPVAIEKDRKEKQLEKEENERQSLIREESYQRKRADIMSKAYSKLVPQESEIKNVVFAARESPFNKHSKGEGKPTDFVLDKKAIKLVEKWNDQS